jgi:hypothetical protein
VKVEGAFQHKVSQIQPHCKSESDIMYCILGFGYLPLSIFNGESDLRLR